MGKRLTTGEFIKKTRAIHGDTYDYSLVEYTGTRNKVKIICKEHGVFEQTPEKHLMGRGCKLCGFKKRADVNTLDEETILQQFINVHNDFYDYSKFIYSGHNVPSLIICPIHGDFEQTPASHKSGKGCLECGKIKTRLSRKISFKQCLTDFKSTHGNTYLYGNFKYINNNTKSFITCRIHGDFLQTPKNHKKGNGCPICKKSKGEFAISKSLDKLNVKYVEQKKFNDCKYKRILPFDFYLPDYNTLIEYHGEQHYKALKHFGGEEAFKMRLFRDEIKNTYAIKNNYNLLIISYKEYNNIDKILKTNVLENLL